ncbi:MAG TPA: 1,4-alpha-glucan branching enzyme, partial [Nitrospiria bacterium]|nr:1,4-alpha-glucan branching enzyme [Nitrospiria bacterium]
MIEKEAKAKENVLNRGTLLTDHDIYLFKEGTHTKLFEKFGAHRTSVDGLDGTHFAVWAPNAGHVSVISDFNRWNPASHPLKVREDGSGIWEGFVPGVREGTIYKYHVASRYHGYAVDKADPFAFFCEAPPRTGSVVHGLGYDWKDGEWMAGRGGANALDAPYSVYEVHLG